MATTTSAARCDEIDNTYSKAKSWGEIIADLQKLESTIDSELRRNLGSALGLTFPSNALRVVDLQRHSFKPIYLESRRQMAIGLSNRRRQR